MGDFKADVEHLGAAVKVLGDAVERAKADLIRPMIRNFADPTEAVAEAWRMRTADGQFILAGIYATYVGALASWLELCRAVEAEETAAAKARANARRPIGFGVCIECGGGPGGLHGVGCSKNDQEVYP